MIRDILEDAAALVSLALVLAVIAVWAAIIGGA